MKNVRSFKDIAFLAGWIAGLLFLIALIWILTQPLQAYHLLRAVNGSLIASGDSRRVTQHINHGGKKADIFGYWYSIYESTDKMFVFSVFQDGILVPLGAVVSDNGSVDDVIPLSAHAVQVFEKIPKSIISMYTARIEAASSANIERNNK